MTELEYCVLGVVWREGPMTAYRVRSHFAESLTSAWSASRGSIYPAILRLRRAGYLRATAPQDGRGARALIATPAGVRALRAWLGGVTPGMSGPTWDPVRTRIQFMDALSSAARRALLAALGADGRAVAKKLRAKAQELMNDPARQSERLGVLGGLHEVEGRLGWLEEVRRNLR